MHAHPVQLSAEPPLIPPARLPAPGMAERIGALAAKALTDELETWPKPGLVSPIDTGSHDDMDEGTFRRSIAALAPFYVRLAAAGAAGASMERLRRIGVEAEAAMREATSGVNTHRGAIFALGLLCAAAGAGRAKDTLAPLSPRLITGTVQRRWGAAILRGPVELDSHGSGALRRYGAGGARMEAAAGFPLAREFGLPALRRGRVLGGSEDAARVQTFFTLLATVEDTNLLHRGGAEGLADARLTARLFIGAGGVGTADWLERAVGVHRDFMRRRLSPGGSADLLAVTLFLDGAERDL